MKGEIKNKELVNTILRRLNKFDSEDFSQEDIEKIDSIFLEFELINGKETGILIRDICYFPNLRSVTICRYSITMDDLQALSEARKIEDVLFLQCEFSNVDFDKLGRIPSNIKFSHCKSLPEKLSNINEIRIWKCRVDLNSINLPKVTELAIQNSTIINARDLTEYENIKSVDFDGSILIKSNGEKTKDIKVNSNCIYTHEEDKYLCPVDDERVNLLSI